MKLERDDAEELLAVVTLIRRLGLGEGAKDDVEYSFVRGGRHVLATEALEVDTQLAVDGVHLPALELVVVLLRSSPTGERLRRLLRGCLLRRHHLCTQRLALASRAPIAHDGILA